MRACEENLRGLGCYRWCARRNVPKRKLKLQIRGD